MASETKEKIDFGEKVKEYSKKTNGDIPVFQLPKYKQSKEKAISLITEGKYGLEPGDFWILMNETKNNKMMYSGLIISHNACLKINDVQEESKKFNPESVTVDKDGYNKSLVFTYCNKEQGIYEVGEVSADNCKNDYKYAMAFKRLFDRVVLKISKIAYSGIYSESESDEFLNQQNADTVSKQENTGISRDDFIKAINEQKTLKSLVKLFNDNQEHINGDKEILTIFKQKKQAFVDAIEKEKSQGAA